MEQTKVKASNRIGNWFKELKAEMKKVVWPSIAKVRQNTVIVLLYVLIVGLVIWALDWLFTTGISFIITK